MDVTDLTVKEYSFLFYIFTKFLILSDCNK